MSEYSAEKPNPTKERTLALGIARERQEDFIIPLNLGLKPTELPWMMSDLSYVDFSTNWAEGLAMLRKALRKAETPCPLDNGADMVSQSIIPQEIFESQSESVYSNFLLITRIPQAVSVIQFDHGLTSAAWRSLQTEWASHRVDDHVFLSFHKPPSGKSYRVVDAHSWQSKDEILGIDSKNLVSELIRKNLHVVCCTKGLVWSIDHRWLHFPYSSKETKRVSFVDCHGKGNNIQVVGERKFFNPGQSMRYRYHLAPTFKVMRDMFGEEFLVKLGVRIRITDTSGRALPKNSALARMKHVSKDWWNHEWLNRYLAICSFLSDGEEEIVIGEQESYQLAFCSKPLSYSSQVSLDEESIDRRREGRKSK